MDSMHPKPGNHTNRSRVLFVGVAIAIAIALAIATTLPPYLWPGAQHTQEPRTSGGSSGLGAFTRVFGSFSSYEEIWSLLSSLEGQVPGIPGHVRAIVTPSAAEGASSAVPASPASFSTTNIQVAGVDELDPVKTNGRLIVVASGNKVYIVDPQGLRILSSISIEGYAVGVFLWGDRLAIVFREDIVEPLSIPKVSIIAPPIRVSGNTSIYVYDVTDPSRPSETARITYSGYLSGARMINSTIYLVLSTPAIVKTPPSVNGTPIDPRLVFLVDPMPSSFITIASLDLSSKGHREFSLMMSSSSWIYMSASRLYIVSTYSAYYKAMARALEILASYMPSNISSQILSLVEKSLYYRAMELVNKYLSTLDQGTAQAIVSNASQKLSTEVFQDTSRIHFIDVKGLEMSYKGYIEIPGHILDQFSIEEHRDYLVAATTSSNLSAGLSASYARVETSTKNATVTITECAGSNCTTRTIAIPLPSVLVSTGPGFLGLYISVRTLGESSNNVYIASLTDNKIVGSLEGLAKGERIYAARLVGDIFYLVTFRQIDPLYAIDLSSPEKPEILGYIKIPGFSEYLHPLTKETLLGIGIENNSLKISLFNTKDPRNIIEEASLKIESARSQALADHHAITIHSERGLLLIPLVSLKYGAQVGGIAVISIGDNSLVLKAILSHEEALRSIYIGDKIYTISYGSINIYDMNSLQKIGQIDLK